LKYSFFSFSFKSFISKFLLLTLLLPLSQLKKNEEMLLTLEIKVFEEASKASK
jgi:hypothetical protein